MDALEKFTRVFSQSGVVWTNEMWDAWRELDAEFQRLQPKEKLEILSPADLKRATNTPWQDKSSY
jgi:enterochelin esterase-like enzyme